MMILLFDAYVLKTVFIVERKDFVFNFKFMVLLPCPHTLYNFWLANIQNTSQLQWPVKQLSEKCWDISWKNSPFDSFLEYKAKVIQGNWSLWSTVAQQNTWYGKLVAQKTARVAPQELMVCVAGVYSLSIRNEVFLLIQ